MWPAKMAVTLLVRHKFSVLHLFCTSTNRSDSWPPSGTLSALQEGIAHMKKTKLSGSVEKTTAQEPNAASAAAVPAPLHDTGLVRTRATRYGLMTYFPHDMYCGRSLDLYGEFSPGEAALFKQIVRPGMTVLDVGANIGIHTVLFAQLVGPQGRVVAYEPQRVVHQMLCANVMTNGLLNVQARHAAAGSKPDTLLVPPVNYNVEGNYGCLSLGQWTAGESVPVETIDSLNLPQCHFIKMDVEGMEVEALRGAVQTLKTKRPILYVENDRLDRSQALIQTIMDADYRLYWHVSHYYTEKNFFQNSENVFKGIVSSNMLCIPREVAMNVDGAREILSADENWEAIFLKQPEPA